MKLPNIFKKSTSIEDEYDEAENVIRSIVNENNNRTPSCKSMDDTFIAQYRSNMDDAEKVRDDLLAEMEYIAYCKINSFPLRTPCTLESIAEQCDVTWWMAKRVMMREITNCPYDSIRVIEILAPGRVETTSCYKSGYKTIVILLSNFRFVRSCDHCISYIERIK